MNAQATTSPLAASSADLQTRITAERERLYLEQNLGVSLENQRLAPLEAGDDEALDRVEQQINSCNDRQSRIQERLEILEKRLANAVANDKAAHLDTIAERAERAREAGERLIRTEYVKAARALAIILDRLRTTDALLEEVNRELEAAGRPCIPSPNAIRERPLMFVDWVEHKQNVPVTHHLSPQFGKVGFGAGHKTAFDLATKEQVPWFCDVDVPHHDAVSPDWQPPLFEAITLPTAEAEPLSHPSLPLVAAPLPIWTPTKSLNDVEPEKIAALVAELEPRKAKASTPVSGSSAQ